MKATTPAHTFPLLPVLWSVVLSLVLNDSFFGWRYFAELPLFLAATAVSLPVILLLSQAQAQLSIRLRKRYPRFDERKSRLALWLTISLLLTVVIVAGLWLLYSLLRFSAEKIIVDGPAWPLLLGAVAQVLAIIVNEGAFTYQQWKAAIVESERMQKITWESRYEGLKQQVNPHFLFNSINTLSSLIYEDKKEAGRYVKEMSRVYRYLLRNNDDELVALETELRFIESYYHLLKTRFGAAIDLAIDVPQRFRNCLLPPLTLQMLVENAVKHNNVSKEAPLRIRIACSNEGWLTVTNNLQPKQGPVDSTGIGLNNIREKYQLLGLPDVSLQTEGKQFEVGIPLVEQWCQSHRTNARRETSNIKR